MPKDGKNDCPPYSYDLPQDRIAQRPVIPPDAARLLVVDRDTQELRESTFAGLAEFIRAGDVLVFNDSRVIPARLLGRLPGGAAVEVLLVERESADCWRCIGKPLKKLKAGVEIAFAPPIEGRVLEREGMDQVRLQFRWGAGRFEEALATAGLMPIPPYIRRGLADEQDRRDYNSMFAAADGSIAAPTASLHFTPELIERLRRHGCRIELVTLHVGPASFLPLWNEDQSAMAREPGKERCYFKSGLLERLAEARAAGGRVIPVGTTVVRALESMARLDSPAADGQLFETELFVRPGYEFKLTDALITNFHQPRTTHLLLVQALLGPELLDRAYQQALRSGFRFLSYGDGMMML